MTISPRPRNHALRAPATPAMLQALLEELDAKPPAIAHFELVSRWAAKHVWRVDVEGQPWAYVRYLLGSAEQYPERWHRLWMSTLLHEARVGPRVLGLTPASAALGGRAAIVEAALRPIPREELEARAVEAVALFARLHSHEPLRQALLEHLSESDRQRIRPLAQLFAETRERWFEAVTARWLEVGLAEPIGMLSAVVGELISILEALGGQNNGIGPLVPTHGDPNHGNFMVNRQGALRLIDFEELALNHPVADLGVFLTWYADKDRHRSLLQHYPLLDADEMLEHMRVWVPLRYLNIAAHWAARLIRAKEGEAWAFAVKSVDEWLRGAAELVYQSAVPSHLDMWLVEVHHSLMERGPLAG